MSLCGSRFGRGAVRPGGHGVSLDDAAVADTLTTLDRLERDALEIDRHFLAAATVQHRLQGTGRLSQEHARALGIVGVAARASGVMLDARSGASRGIYGAVPIPVSVHSTGDCWARTRMRMDEVIASLAWLRVVLPEHTPRARRRTPLGSLAPCKLAVSVVEGWRGEVVHAIETDAAGQLAHYKVQDPSLRNWMGLAMAVRGNEISDFPICNKSFDLSYCGNDL
jgi:Ni,Fe-hydrogenase III large subunit